jgi:phenylacetate-coenzyme A ligase PaaK-like adenylate-forming protein
MIDLEGYIMGARRKLFHHRQVYDLPGTNELFIKAVRENAEWHYQNCDEYRKILDSRQFRPDMLAAYEDLYRLPPIPTLYLKQHQMLSIAEKKLRFKSTTSGTSGKPIEVGFNTGALFLGFHMLRKMLTTHKLISLRPTNYLILGYQPSKHNKMGAVRTAYGATFLAPPLHKEYALLDTGLNYALNLDGVMNALLRYSRGKSPVRILGFPAYFFFLLKKLEQENISLKLPEASTVLLGGGWKQFASQKVDKSELYRLAQERLGIREERFQEFFGVVEHNIPYFDCKNHHFHVPVYSRVIIRDTKTMMPVENGSPGLLNLITPFLDSMPLVSIMTDDIAILREGKECGCGNASPYFEILGRAGLQGITTCAAGAGSMLEGIKI